MDVSYDVIDKEIYNKYDSARMLERYFSADDYMWILGFEVWRRISFEYFREPLPIDGSSEPKILMGIPVRIDTNNPFKIKLYKEIK